MIDEKLIEKYRCPRWAELPGIPLYMDQVVMVISEALCVFAENDEPVITSTMINNYVKQKLISPPENKKYSRNQIGRLIVLTVFKRVFSIAEITLVIADMENAYGVDTAYDIFCDALETHLKSAFTKEKYCVEITKDGEPAKRFLNTALGAVMCKLSVQNATAELAAAETAEKEKSKVKEKPAKDAKEK